MGNVESIDNSIADAKRSLADITDNFSGCETLDCTRPSLHLVPLYPLVAFGFLVPHEASFLATIVLKAHRPGSQGQGEQGEGVEGDRNSRTQR